MSGKVVLGKDGLPVGQLFRGLTSLERFKENVAELLPNKSAKEQEEIAKACHVRKSTGQPKAKRVKKAIATVKPVDEVKPGKSGKAGFYTLLRFVELSKAQREVLNERFAIFEVASGFASSEYALRFARAKKVQGILWVVRSASEMFEGGYTLAPLKQSHARTD